MQKAQLWDFGKWILGVSILAVTLSGPANADTTGRATVTSGDTLRIDGKEFRLYGLDAPERDQYCEDQYLKTYQCGTYAKDALRRMIGRLDVTCVEGKEDEEGRVLATCYAGDTNLNSRMVRDGWAISRPEENQNYVPLEKMAKQQKKGIWQYIFEDPKKWREYNQ